MALSFKHSLIIVTLIVCQLAAYAQTYDTPESVEFYPADSSYFVANANGGAILKLNADNSLSPFVSGLAFGPHGLELVGDTLYACTGGTIHAFNASTGNMLFEIPIGGSFLNGITHVGNQLFITDFTERTIITYRINSNQFNVFVGGLLKTPNGIIYDSISNRLVMVNWGGSTPIIGISLTDSTTTELTTTSLNNCDGIAMDCSGNFYVSSWSPQRISIFDHTFTDAPLTADIPGIQNPADIYFNELFDTLVIPSSGNDKVIKAYFESCQIIDTSVSIITTLQSPIQIYPNPVGEVINYSGLTSGANTTIYIFDIQGKLVHQVIANNQPIPLEQLIPGIYFIQFITEGQLPFETYFSKL